MKTKSNFSLKRIVSLILAFAMLFTITVSLDFSVFAASCKHNPSAGNSGKWFNSISECDDYWADVLEVWDEKYESGEVTYVEWVEGHPGGYSAWTCYYCQMWTVDFFIVKKPAIINGERKQLYLSRLVLKETPEKDIVCSVI